MRAKNLKNKKNKKNNEKEKEKNIILLKKMLQNKIICIKRKAESRPNTPTPEQYENINIDNLKNITI